MHGSQQCTTVLVAICLACCSLSWIWSFCVPVNHVMACSSYMLHATQQSHYVLDFIHVACQTTTGIISRSPWLVRLTCACQLLPALCPACHTYCMQEPFTLLGFLVQDSAALALQVSVLLLGPRGSGRATAVRAATAALGIHLVPFSCHDLKGQSDSQTATALKASLEAAQGFAPVVLLLRHFEVLAESPQGASQGECQWPTVPTVVIP